VIGRREHPQNDFIFMSSGCIRPLLCVESVVKSQSTNYSTSSQSLMLSCVQSREKKSVRVQADDPVSFLQLTSKNDLGTTEASLQINKHSHFCTDVRS